MCSAQHGQLLGFLEAAGGAGGDDGTGGDAGGLGALLRPGVVNDGNTLRLRMVTAGTGAENGAGNGTGGRGAAGLLHVVAKGGDCRLRLLFAAGSTSGNEGARGGTGGLCTSFLPGMGNLRDGFGFRVGASCTGLDDGTGGGAGGRGTARLLHVVTERLADSLRLGLIAAGALILSGAGSQTGGRITAGFRPGVAKGRNPDTSRAITGTEMDNRKDS